MNIDSPVIAQHTVDTNYDTLGSLYDETAILPGPLDYMCLRHRAAAVFHRAALFGVTFQPCVCDFLQYPFARNDQSVRYGVA